MSNIILFQGGDEVLLAEAARTAAHEALGDQPADLALAEIDEAACLADDAGNYSLGAVVDAAQTPPFLTDRRVVIGRQLARFSTQDSVAPLLRYLEDPLDTTTLILVWSKGPKLTRNVGGVPKKLVDAVKAAGGEIKKVDVGTGKAAKAWLDDRIKQSSLKIDARAKALLGDHLGEDKNRLGALLRSLESTYGPGASVGAEEITPFLGEAGGIPPWELTDAMSSGDIAAALSKLRRMMGAGERHPIAILSTLHTHYGRMMQLDGAAIAGEKDAAAILGMKGSTFPAKKAMQQSRKMGSDRVRTAMSLLAETDLDLRGRVATDGDTQMEVLVARLTRLSR